MGWMEAGKGEVWGDEPQDVMDEAVEKIIKIFQRCWDRNPTMGELKNHLRFSAESMLEEAEAEFVPQHEEKCVKNKKTKK